MARSSFGQPCKLGVSVRAAGGAAQGREPTALAPRSGFGAQPTTIGRDPGFRSAPGADLTE